MTAHDQFNTFLFPNIDISLWEYTVWVVYVARLGNKSFEPPKSSMFRTVGLGESTGLEREPWAYMRGGMGHVVLKSFQHRY